MGTRPISRHLNLIDSRHLLNVCVNHLYQAMEQILENDGDDKASLAIAAELLTIKETIVETRQGLTKLITVEAVEADSARVRDAVLADEQEEIDYQIKQQEIRHGNANG